MVFVSERDMNVARTSDGFSIVIAGCDGSWSSIRPMERTREEIAAVDHSKPAGIVVRSSRMVNDVRLG